MIKRLIIFIVILFFLPFNAVALDFIPGLKGFGTDTRGPYAGSGNPTIYMVNTLANNTTTPTETTRNGVTVYTGALKACLSDTTYCSAGTGRIILFEVSGYIQVDGYLYSTKDYVFIAGQTAPSPGITLRGANLNIRYCNDFIMQHIRSRSSDEPTSVSRSAGIKPGVIYGDSDTKNIIIDHCSFSWGADDLFDIGDDNTGGLPNSITLSYCIFSEPLETGNDSGVHNMCVMAQKDIQNFIIRDCLFAHSENRNPGIWEGHYVVANNLNYNCWYGGGRQFRENNRDIEASIVGNVMKSGVNSSTQYSWRFAADNHSGTSAEIFIDDHIIDGSPSSAWDNVFDTGNAWETNAKVLSAPNYPSGYTPAAASTVEASVLTNSGARPEDRCLVDTRIIAEATTGDPSGNWVDVITYQTSDCVSVDIGPDGYPMWCCSGAGSGDCVNPDDVEGGTPTVGFPTLAENTNNVYTNLGFPSDPHGDDDTDGYTNIEEWLHGLAGVVEGNAAVYNINLVDGQTNTSTTVDLSYKIPGGCQIDLYFEKDDATPDVLVLDDSTAETYDPGTMDGSSTYYYQFVVDPTDPDLDTVTSSVYSFTTADPPPGTENLSEGAYFIEGSFKIRYYKEGQSVRHP